MQTNPGFEATASILDEVNVETGSTWQLETRLAGGVLGGAWRIKSGASSAVFKWHDPTSSVPHNPDAAGIVAYIRDRGYPTPAWLFWGTSPAGIAWSVQELIPGKSMGQVDAKGAELIIQLVKMHRRLSPPTPLSWSAFMRDLAFDDDHPSRNRIRRIGGSFASALSDALELAAPHAGVRLPENEMVHCDLSVSNILLHHGKLSGVIDIDAAGRGCAVYDVLTPAIADAIWSPTGGPIRLLHEYAIETYGAPAVAIAAATLAIEKLDWFAESPDDLDVKAEKCQSWIATIRDLL